MKKSILRTMMAALAMIVAMNANAQGKLNPGADSKGVATNIGADVIQLDYAYYYDGVYYAVTEEVNSASKEYNVAAVGVYDATATDVTIYGGFESDGCTFIVTKVGPGSYYKFNASETPTSKTAFTFNGAMVNLTIGNQNAEDNDLYYNCGEIASAAFANCTSIATVTAIAPTPSTCATDAFADATYKSATLTVPSSTGALTAYAAATGWSKFIKVSDGTGMLGDLNNDGTFTAGDISYLISLIGSSNVYADLNGDGAVTSSDISFMIAKINAK